MLLSILVFPDISPTWIPTCGESIVCKLFNSPLVTGQNIKGFCYNQLDLEQDIHPWESPVTSSINITKSIGNLKAQGQAPHSNIHKKYCDLHG